MTSPLLQNARHQAAFDLCASQVPLLLVRLALLHEKKQVKPDEIHFAKREANTDTQRTPAQGIQTDFVLNCHFPNSQPFESAAFLF